MRRTEAVEFADHLILAIRGETVSEAKNVSSLKVSKITPWWKSNKVGFNGEKSTVMLISRRKRKESKEINIYLNNRHLVQVTTIKYLGIITDNKLKFS
jgi:hypothetical protein